MIRMSNDELLDISMELAGSNRPQDCTTGAFLLRILLLQPNIQDFLLNPKETLPKYLTPSALTQWEDLLNGTQNLKAALQKISQQASSNDSSRGTLLLVWILLLYLEDQLKIAKNGLFIAAATKPMYPTLHCIRYILFGVNLRYAFEFNFLSIFLPSMYLTHVSSSILWHIIFGQSLCLSARTFILTIPFEWMVIRFSHLTYFITCNKTFLFIQNFLTS